jgi:uncharacterized protein YutE (UPF0331/DUF86 family)
MADDQEFHRRYARTRALELAVETVKDVGGYSAKHVVDSWAKVYYDWIWEGK